MRRENVWRRVRGDRRQYWQRWPRWSDPRGIHGIARYSLATPYTRRLDPWPIEPTFCLCFSFASSTFFLSLFFFFFLVPCPLERFSPFPTLCSLFLFSWRESHCFTLYIRCPSRVIRLSVVDGHKRFQRFHDPPMVARSDNYWPRATLLK